MRKPVGATPTAVLAVRVPEDVLAAFDIEIATLGTTRAQVIRKVIAKWIRGRREIRRLRALALILAASVIQIRCGTARAQADAPQTPAAGLPANAMTCEEVVTIGAPNMTRCENTEAVCWLGTGGQPSCYPKPAK